MYEEIKPLQDKQYEILKEFKRICDKNNLNYYLDFGTLLGAIRHEGFIPWDDDIDVCMFYNDYVKIDEICKTELGPEFFLQSIDTESVLPTTAKKLRLSNTTYIVKKCVDKDINYGIDIDIYPMFYVSNNKLERQLQCMVAIFYLLLIVGGAPKSQGKIVTLGSKITLAVVRGRFRQWLIKKSFKFISKYVNEKTDYCVEFFGNPKICRTVYKSSYFDETVEKKFVDEQFKVPAGYDGILTLKYGDYMTLPPEEERRVKLDDIVKIDTETPYTEYKGIYYCVDEAEK